MPKTKAKSEGNGILFNLCSREGARGEGRGREAVTGVCGSQGESAPITQYHMGSTRAVCPTKEPISLPMLSGAAGGGQSPAHSPACSAILSCCSVPIWNFLSGKGCDNCLSYLHSAFQTTCQTLQPLYRQSSQGHPDLAQKPARAPRAGCYVGAGSRTADWLVQGPALP